MTSRQHKKITFLTEKEVERIQNTVKDRVQKCSALAGNAREPRDSKQAIREATGAALMADMGSASEPESEVGTLPALSVGQPYPPCSVPLKDLQPMKLGELKMDTHHRGRRLAVKRASPVVTLTARSWTLVQDEEEGGESDVERLEVCLHKSRHGEDILETASAFVIKEPYFTLTDQGEPTIRIDHPTDLIVIRKETATSTSASAEDATAAEKLAKSCKDKGNAALAQQRLPLAHAHYTEGLRFAQQDLVAAANPDLARDLFRNRAHVNLLLERLDEAKTDALASLIRGDDQRSKDLDSKAYFRAGTAAYNLGQYEEAKTLFEERLKLMPGNKEALAYLRAIEKRLGEQENGSYDWAKIKAGLSRARPRVDAASFIRNTRVADSPGMGHGLFATRDIAEGEIALCDKAFCIVWGHEAGSNIAVTYDVRDDQIRISPVGLTQAVVQKLLNNPSQIPKVMGLYGDYQGSGDADTTADPAAVDVFRVHDIVARNSFGPNSIATFGDEDPDPARRASTALWAHAAYANHSCAPNLAKENVGDLLVLRATRAIAAGEELFVAYDEIADFDARERELQTNWGFTCRCGLCAAERADSAEVRRRRAELAAEAERFIERENRPAAAPAARRRLLVTKAQRLAKAIEETYDEERYKGLPRLAAKRIREWLESATPRR